LDSLIIFNLEVDENQYKRSPLALVLLRILKILRQILTGKNMLKDVLGYTAM
jgi:hypothetical protein